MAGTVVVIAFGPLKVTRAALARARHLAGPRGRLLVLDGVPGATAALRRTAGVEVVPGRGRDALERALGSCGDEPVLLLHDDVLLPLQSYRALLAAFEGRVPVVPRTNDPGTDHSLGELPPVRSAEQALRISAGRWRRPGLSGRSRTSCVLSSARQLRPLLAHHLTAAGTIVVSPQQPFRIAGGAVAAHDAACGGRRAEPEGFLERPLLVASMIVKDEERFLGDCLAAMQGLVDRVDVCDTGSSDRTVEIAQAAGATVVRAPWRGDFAEARNVVLDRSRDAWWVLQIDADERVVAPDPAALRARLATAVGEFDGYAVRIRNVYGPQGTVGSRFNAGRVFRPDGVRYVGALHEQAVRRDGTGFDWTLLDGIALDHLGYDGDVFTSREKGSRNVAISRAAYEADPRPQQAMNYARSLTSDGGDPVLIERLYRELVDGAAMHTAGRAMALAQLAGLRLSAGDPAEAATLAEEALELVPADDHAAAVHLRATRALGDLPRGVAVADRRRAAFSSDQGVRITGESVEALALEARSRVEGGDREGAEQALSRALAEVEEGFGGWADLLAVAAALDGDGLPARFGPLVPRDPVVLLSAAAQTIPPALTAELCALYVDRGGREPIAVEVGVLAALVADRLDLVGRLWPAVEAASPERRSLLAERARARGAAELAARLDGAVLSGS